LGCYKKIFLIWMSKFILRRLNCWIQIQIRTFSWRCHRRTLVLDKLQVRGWLIFWSYIIIKHIILNILILLNYNFWYVQHCITFFANNVARMNFQLNLLMGPHLHLQRCQFTTSIIMKPMFKHKSNYENMLIYGELVFHKLASSRNCSCV